MKDKKYYTPAIEEFHVGFEFEYDNGKEYTTHEIEEHQLSTPNIGEACESEITDIIRDLRKGLIRVKYLDQQDIESLGWVPNDGHSNWFKYPINNGYPDCFYHLTTYQPEGNNILRYIIEVDMIIVSVAGIDPYEKRTRHHHVFVGTIKNKSELIRLMRQLNITKQ